MTDWICTLKAISGPAAVGAVNVEIPVAFEPATILGREDADITILDEELSRRHASVRLTETGALIEDLGSLNGTFLGEERISGPVTLTADATIRVGRSKFLLSIAAVPEPEPEPEDAGRTRLAKTPDLSSLEPQLTRIRPTVDTGEEEPTPAPPPEPPPIPQPQATRIRPAVSTPDANATPAPTPTSAPTPTPTPTPTREDEPSKPPRGLGRLFARIRGKRQGGE